MYMEPLEDDGPLGDRLRFSLLRRVPVDVELLFTWRILRCDAGPSRFLFPEGYGDDWRHRNCRQAFWSRSLPPQG
jgi:hypothetical protein